MDSGGRGGAEGFGLEVGMGAGVAGGGGDAHCLGGGLDGLFDREAGQTSTGLVGREMRVEGEGSLPW